MTERRGRPPRLHEDVESELIEHLRAKDMSRGRKRQRPRNMSLLAAIWNLTAAQIVRTKIEAGASERDAVSLTAAEILPREHHTAKGEDRLRDIARRWGKRLRSG